MKGIYFTSEYLICILEYICVPFICYTVLVWNILFRSWGQLKCDGTRTETRFRLLAKRTRPFKSAGGVSSVDYWQPRCAPSAVIMLDTPCSEVAWRVLATHSIRQFPLHFPSLRHHVTSHFDWSLTHCFLIQVKITCQHMALYSVCLLDLMCICKGLKVRM